MSPVGPFPDQDCLGTYALRDAGTILVSKAHQRGWTKAPDEGERVVWPLCCKQHTVFHGLPVYHGKGWLPDTLGPTTLVATPSVYKDYDKQWAVRRLRDAKLYEAFGLPSAFVELMSEDKFRN